MWRAVTRPKMMVESAEVAVGRCAKGEPRGIVPPAKGTVEDPIAWDKCIGVKSRVPIPPCVGPHAWRPTAAASVPSGRVHVGIRQVRRTQARPAIEIILIRFAIEF